MLAHQPSDQLQKSLFLKQDLWIQPMLCYVVIKTDTNEKLHWFPLKCIYIVFQFETSALDENILKWFILNLQCCQAHKLEIKKMGVKHQTYAISKRLEVKISAWYAFVKFLEHFKMVMVTHGFQVWNIKCFFSFSIKTERLTLYFAVATALVPWEVFYLCWQ